MHNHVKLVDFQTIRGEPHVLLKGSSEKPVSFLSLCLEHYFCLSQIAQVLEVSSTTLRKAFTEYAGISPKVWMTQQRVVLAMRLIREGKSLSAVADRMAYSDYRHMSKEFRTVVEYTPKSMSRLLKGLQGEAKIGSS